MVKNNKNQHADNVDECNEKLEENLNCEKSQDVQDDDSMVDKIQDLSEKLAELNDKYLRVYSEYENYRKRTAVEKADLILNGGKDVVKAILPIVDDMERSLSVITDEATREGQQLIYNKLMATLSQKGVKPMDALNVKFDENLHEAITQIPAQEESQKGMNVDVVEKGYFMNEKVLRYAKVVVAV